MKQLVKTMYLIFILPFILSLCSGCSTAILAQRGPYLDAYHEGNFSQAEQRVNALSCQTKTETNFQLSKEAIWLLLDRATLHFAMNKTKEAIADYAKSLEAIDFYNQSVATEKIAQILTQDETSAYQADDFEQILARVYFSFALLHQNDESNAYAILRQAEEFEQEKRQQYHTIPFTRDYNLPSNPLSKYLLALLSERRGDLSNATILYQQAGAPPQLHKKPFPHQIGQQATVLVVCHNGNVPYKISTTSPASVASACALEFLLSTQRIDPAWSSLTGIPVPALKAWPHSSPIRTFAQIKETNTPLFPFYNITQAATEELNQKLPVIAARGVARLLIRRTAVEYCNRQDPCLGVLADLTMLVINDQTRADTRSWTTLPAEIDLARFDVDPGTHTLKLQIGEGAFKSTDSYSLDLAPHDLCIVHIFNIHPGVKTILIPKRYTIEHQGESLCYLE